VDGRDKRGHDGVGGCGESSPLGVMAGLVPAIHVFLAEAP